MREVVDLLQALVFTALRGMQTRSGYDNTVCLSQTAWLSVRPSNAWNVTKRKKGLSRFL